MMIHDSVNNMNYKTATIIHTNTPLVGFIYINTFMRWHIREEENIHHTIHTNFLSIYLDTERTGRVVYFQYFNITKETIVNNIWASSSSFTPSHSPSLSYSLTLSCSDYAQLQNDGLVEVFPANLLSIIYHSIFLCYYYALTHTHTDTRTQELGHFGDCENCSKSICINFRKPKKLRLHLVIVHFRDPLLPSDNNTHAPNI